MKNKNYIIIPSQRKNKKYDVYIDGEYLLSFGDKNYSQYHDQFGYYSHLDHNDEKRRDNYRARHKHTNINDPNYPAYWSMKFLW